MKKVIVSRRQVLRGAGGFVLGLPFLPSLVPGRAFAQSVSFARQPRFVSMATNHGGLREAAMFPDEASLTETYDLYPGHTIRRGTLQRLVNGSDAGVSEVLTAPADRLTDRLVSKMNVLWGLDIPFYIAHHTGGHLGNFARNDGNGGDGQMVQQQHMPTIDQLMAWSPSFYPDLAGVTQRTLVTGTVGRLSWGFSNPSSQSGDIQEVRGGVWAHELFDQVFPAPDQVGAQTRAPIVDRVLEAYNSLRQGNRRLSADDRQRLDDHMDRLAELSRRLGTRNAACEGLAPPARSTEVPESARLWADVISAALVCGASRIAVFGAQESAFVPYGGDWHQDVAHQWMLDGPQMQLRQANRESFARFFVELAAALDSVEEEPGVSVLDNTLMAWTQESGEVTHEARSIPIVTFGGAAGRLSTGQFCDYRRRTPEGMRSAYGEDQGYSGLLYQQWLATCLQAMGLARSEWQGIPNNGATGYGLPLIDDTYAPTHAPGVVDNASDTLPFLAA